jgi:hypothetical protein
MGDKVDAGKVQDMIEEFVKREIPAVAAQGQKDQTGLVARITDYLTGGGLFNPEMAIHERVRDLLIDCREALRGSPARSAPEVPEGKRPNYDTPEEIVDHIVGMVADDGSISPYARDLAIDYLETRLKYAALPGSLPTQPTGIEHPHFPHKLPCGCEWQRTTEDLAGPVMWNPYNGVVQCHKCGQVYSPGSLPSPAPQPNELCGIEVAAQFGIRCNLEKDHEGSHAHIGAVPLSGPSKDADIKEQEHNCPACGRWHSVLKLQNDKVPPVMTGIGTDREDVHPAWKTWRNRQPKSSLLSPGESENDLTRAYDAIAARWPESGSTFPELQAQAEPSSQAIDSLAAALNIRTWDQGDDGFGGEWVIDAKKVEAIKQFWKTAWESGPSLPSEPAHAATCRFIPSNMAEPCTCSASMMRCIECQQPVCDHIFKRLAAVPSEETRATLKGILVDAVNQGCNCWNSGEDGHKSYCFIPKAQLLLQEKP